MLIEEFQQILILNSPDDFLLVEIVHIDVFLLHEERSKGLMSMGDNLLTAV
jgi:hypothetical protein